MGPVAARTGCLHELFEAQVDLRPHQPAVLCGDETLSYRELDDWSNRLARFLQTCGVRPGVLVGLYFQRSARPVVAVLAVLKAGAGYVPIDSNYPEDRVRHILSDAEVAVLLSEQALSEKASAVFDGRRILIDTDADEIARQPTSRLSRDALGLVPDDLCYVIYTSGTTGRPKGVVTEHRNAVHFVFAFKDVCRLRDTDRVYQGFSLGFDGSVEEIWMAFSSGAALVVGTQEVARLPNEVARLLTEKKVTFFSTVPTFLSMVKEDLPTVRLLVVSGEQCPPELVAKWARPGRRMLNVYGPTEATVNTTAAVCSPRKPVTIGKPLPGYEIHVLDAGRSPVSPGDPGELYVGGPGIARGYLNQPELTAKQFVPNPFNGNGSGTTSRLYRTGDLVRVNRDGDLQFLGRIDSQVKIRGFRIELSEIEAVLLEHPVVRAAAVNVVDRDGVQDLAAYVVADDQEVPFDRGGVLGILRARLPAYMIPGHLDVMEALPTLSSGKVDRGRLPAPVSPLVQTEREIVTPQSDLEHEIAGVWKRVLKISPLSVEDDFFLDLGGHSLLAAQMVSLLRNELKLDVAIRDVYRNPTVRKLAEHLASAPAPGSSGMARDEQLSGMGSNRPVRGSVRPSTRRFCFGLQAVSLYLLYGVMTLPVVALSLLFVAFRESGLSAETTLVVTAALSVGVYPVMLALTILAKWLVIGRYRPGKYPVWGFYYLRWWFVTRLQALSGAGLLAGTPLMSLYYRLMGAKVGRNSNLDTPLCAIFDLVTIGEDTSIGSETQLLGYRVEDGMLHLGRVDIGSRCFVGIHSTIGLDARMGDDARLDDLSLLGDGEAMDRGESRRGSPSQAAPVAVPEEDERPPTPRRPRLFGVLYLLTVCMVHFFLIITGLPAFYLTFYSCRSGGLFWGAASLLVAAPLLVVSFCLSVAAAKALLLGRVRPGIYPLESSFYLRKWFIDSLVRISCTLVRPLYTTLYLPPWLRLLGARIGARAEIATVSQISPDLMVVDEESFFADGSIVGGRRIFRGRVQVAENRVGRRSFVGNSAILPMGASLGSNCLIGCLSAPPLESGTAPDGTDWLGSPSFRLPRRQKVGGFDEEVTYQPTRKLYVQRSIVDALRIIIPNAVALAGVAALVFFVLASFESLGVPATLALAPVVGFALAVSASLCVVAVKKLLMGTFEPTVKPLWSMFVWLNELVNGAYESVAAPALTPLLGTPFFPAYLRLLGCKIGRHVFLETTLFSEFDLVEIGDHAELNAGAVIQNHLFEDRVMKSSRLKIGDACSVGNMAVILYDTEMQEGASIGPLSLLMKGETLPPSTHWHGIPTGGTMRRQPPPAQPD